MDSLEDMVSQACENLESLVDDFNEARQRVKDGRGSIVTKVGVPLKIAVIGDPKVGKTTLIAQAIRSPDLKNNLCSRLEVSTSSGINATLDVCDCPPAHVFQGMRAKLRKYCGGAHGVIFVFDATSVASVDALNEHYNFMRNNGMPHVMVQMIPVGCKMDLLPCAAQLVSHMASAEDPKPPPVHVESMDAATLWAKAHDAHAPVLATKNDYNSCVAPFQQLAELVARRHTQVHASIFRDLQVQRAFVGGKIGVRLQAYLVATRKRYASWELTGKPLSAFFVRNEYDRICKTLQRHHRELQTENLKMPIELFIEMMSFLPPPISPTDRGFVCDAVPKIAMTCMMGLLLVRENASLKSAQPLYE